MTPETVWGKDTSGQAPKGSYPGVDAVGKDNSTSLILAEQAKSLPEALRTDDQTDTREADQNAQVREATGKSTNEILSLLSEAENQGRTYLTSHVNPERARAYAAFRNQHFGKSKYLDKKLFGARSKLFKPKTRGAVRKAQASAAGALFATADVVTVDPQDNSNPVQRASADFKKELLNYRLTRSNQRDAIPWFLTAMGAHQDAMITGICVSKQSWRFRERTAAALEKNPNLTRILTDRPDVLNIPPENIVFDPECEWTNPAQTSAYFIVRYPLPIHEVEAMMRPTAMAAQPKWFKLERERLLELSGMPPDDVRAVRDARSGGADGKQGATASGHYRTLWVYENFFVIDGEDYTFWSVGNQQLLSVPQLTEEVYPHLFGDRPITVGFGALETHRPYPMGPVSSWQQLQQEANDITNLRLDQMKQVVSPLAKVKRGRQVDIDVLMRRAPNTVLHVMDKDDVEWDRPPDVPASAMAEGNILNNDFDELAGVFSQGSVQSNRSLNETVGGMKLLSGSANAITEFDLRVWVETWVEPTINQVMKLEEFYESNEVILAIAGQKAGLVEKYGIDAITDDLLKMGVTVKVGVGIGAADPMQRLEKFSTAAKVAGEILAPFVQAGTVTMRPNVEAIIDEAFGPAGYKDAGKRFFEIGDPAQPQTDPAAAAAQADVQKHAMTLEDKEKDRKAKLAIADAQLHDKQAEREHQAEQQHIKSVTELERARIAEVGQNTRLGREHSHKSHENHIGHVLDALMAKRAADQAAVDRRQQASDAIATRTHAAAQANQDRSFQASQADANRKAAEQKAAAQPQKAAA